MEEKKVKSKSKTLEEAKFWGELQSPFRGLKQEVVKKVSMPNDVALPDFRNYQNYYTR